MEPECYSPESGTFFFLLIALLVEGGATAAVLTLDPIADKSKKMAGHVARSRARLCSRKIIFVSINTLILLLLLFGLASPSCLNLFRP